MGNRAHGQAIIARHFCPGAHHIGTVQAAEIAGIRGVLVHAISEAAKRFYESCGFIASPIDPMTLVLTVAEAARIIGDKGRG